MDHHQVCRIPTCPVCVPVNEIIAEEHLLVSMLEQQQQLQCAGDHQMNGQGVQNSVMVLRV